MPAQINLESLFAAAADIDDEARRREFLASACGDDRGLRQQLEDLLAAHPKVGAFMESHAAAYLVATALHDSIGEKPGDLIGPYKLLEQIGEGGMGLVFMAEQSQPLRRRVALKIIKPGLDTRSVIARFEAERQALALMDHPNIARVFDAGATDSGRPYFVMELVRGAPITAYCCDRNLPLRERLALFIDVCHAVQHAHQKGVIHRDLKPTNILVALSDTGPVPKVIDFGVAKATTQPLTERTLFTSFLQIIGTPLYMSPEQAELGNQDVDTRSDVYSLGVVLYELLTGMTPFDVERLRSVGVDEMRRIIREEEPPKPSTRATTAAAVLSTVAAEPRSPRRAELSALKGELDWIIMKALEKDRRRRYDSPNALAADIARYLNNEPVDAHPPTRRYLLVNFARRNRAMLLTSGAIAGALLLGVGVSVWQAMQAREAEKRATKALAIAEDRLHTTRRAVDEMYSQVAEKWLFKEGIMTPVQREFLQKAVAYYRDFAAENPVSPQARFDVGVALRRQAYILDHLGDAVGAEKANRESVSQLQMSLPSLSDQASGRMQLADALHQLGQMMRTSRRFDEALSLLQRAVFSLEAAAALESSTPQFHRLMGKIHFTLASVHLDQGRYEEAEAAFRRCQEQFGKVLVQEPQDAWSINHVAVAEHAHADVLTHLGRREEARPRFQRSIELCRRAVEIDPAESLFRYHLAVALTAASANYAVDDHFQYDQEAYDVARKLAEEFPDRPGYLEQFIVCQQNFIITLEDSDRERMLTIARSGLAPARRLKSFPGNPDYYKHFVGALIVLHQALLANDLPQEAAQVRFDAIEEVRAEPGCRQHLGYLKKICAADLYSFGHSQPAIPLMEESLAEDPSQAGPTAWVVLALAHASAGDMDVARRWLDKAAPLPEPRPKSELTTKLYNEAVEMFGLTVDPNRAH